MRGTFESITRVISLIKCIISVWGLKRRRTYAFADMKNKGIMIKETFNFKKNRMKPLQLSTILVPLKNGSSKSPLLSHTASHKT